VKVRTNSSELKENKRRYG